LAHRKGGVPGTAGVISSLDEAAGEASLLRPESADYAVTKGIPGTRGLTVCEDSLLGDTDDRGWGLVGCPTAIACPTWSMACRASVNPVSAAGPESGTTRSKARLDGDTYSEKARGMGDVRGGCGSGLRAVCKNACVIFWSSLATSSNYAASEKLSRSQL
jgi:hypothetical protein